MSSAFGFFAALPSIQNDYLKIFFFCEAYRHQSIALWQIFRASDHPRVCHSLRKDLPLSISSFRWLVETLLINNLMASQKFLYLWLELAALQGV